MKPMDFLSDSIITFPQYINQNIFKMATDQSGNINYKIHPALIIKEVVDPICVESIL